MFKTTPEELKAVIEKYPCKEISIEITEKCNMKCIHCSSDAGEAWGNELSLDEIKEVIRLGFEYLGTEVISLSGGDPILAKYFIPLVEFIALEMNLQLLIYSSGSVVTSKGEALSYTETFPYQCIKGHMQRSGCKMIYSIEGGNRFSHEFVTRINGSWDTLWRSIRTSIDDCIFTELHTCPMTINMYELEDLYEKLCDEDVDRWSLLRLVPQGRCSKASYLLTNPREFNELVGIIQKILVTEREKRAEGDYATEVRVGDPLNFYGCWDAQPIIPMTTCNAGKNRMLIRANGETQFCAALKIDPKYDYGNIRETNIVDLWCSSDRVKMLREFHEGGYKKMMGKCGACKNLEICKGGCLSQRLKVYDNTLMGPDPLCPFVYRMG